MARRKHEDTQQPTTDENHGKGGSYVNGEDGVRRLVERSEHADRIPSNIPHEPPEEADETAVQE